MAGQKVHAFTAREEVAWRDRYDAVFAAAGWRLRNQSRSRFGVPFCAGNQVAYLEYSGLFRERIHSCWVMVPLAHNFYEKRYLNAVEKHNLQVMEPYGLTMDPEANAVLRMCL